MSGDGCRVSGVGCPRKAVQGHTMVVLAAVGSFWEPFVQ